MQLDKCHEQGRNNLIPGLDKCSYTQNKINKNKFKYFFAFSRMIFKYLILNDLFFANRLSILFKPA